MEETLSDVSNVSNVSDNISKIKELSEELAKRFGAKPYSNGFVVPREKVYDLILFLRDSRGFNYLRDVTSVDWLGKRGQYGLVVEPELEARFDLIYQVAQLNDSGDGATLAVKTSIDDSQTIKSICSIYPAANFFEREVYDLMGVKFTDHPDLRRILLSDDWEGHPLRKDYPVSGYDMWDWEAHR